VFAENAASKYVKAPPKGYTRELSVTLYVHPARPVEPGTLWVFNRGEIFTSLWLVYPACPME